MPLSSNMLTVPPGGSCVRQPTPDASIRQAVLLYLCSHACKLLCIHTLYVHTLAIHQWQHLYVTSYACISKNEMLNPLSTLVVRQQCQGAGNATVLLRSSSSWPSPRLAAVPCNRRHTTPTAQSPPFTCVWHPLPLLMMDTAETQWTMDHFKGNDPWQ